jgi:DNA replicative helicase MCM subunit Mcm2 (Cdc46/Mcm family)
MLKVMEDGIKAYVKEKKDEFPNTKDGDWQVSVCSDEFPRKLRDITSNLVSKLFVVSGIIITATKPYIKASKLKLKCKNCLATRIIDIPPGQYPYVPTVCQGLGGLNQKCPNDPYVAMPDS